jgi:predicted nuclease of predicted toxin-antitoxin system
MKLLFDRNLSFKLCEQLADLFPQSEQIHRLGLAQADDRAVWRNAGTNEYVLVSLDSDFAEMTALLGPPPKVIWLRCGNQPTSVIEQLLRSRSGTIAAFEHDAAACLEVY